MAGDLRLRLKKVEGWVEYKRKGYQDIDMRCRILHVFNPAKPGLFTNDMGRGLEIATLPLRIDRQPHQADAERRRKEENRSSIPSD